MEFTNKIMSNEEMQKRIIQLEQKIAELERNVDSAEPDIKLQQRGFLKTFSSEIETASMSADAGFRRTISIGAGGGSASVPAFPTRWRKLRDGSELWVPLYAFDSRY